MEQVMGVTMKHYELRAVVKTDLEPDPSPPDDAAVVDWPLAVAE